MKKMTMVSALVVFVIVGVGGVLYVNSRPKPPTVTFDGKIVPLIEENYNGKYNAQEKVADLVKDKHIKPVILSNQSTFTVQFSDLDAKSNYSLIHGNEQGWMMEFIQNGKKLNAGQQQKGYTLIRVSKYLQVGDPIYEFVIENR